MRGLTRWLLGTVCALLLGGPARAVPAEADPANRVVILANSSQPDSVDLARHYAARRGVPAANIVALPMPAEETIGWDAFIATVFQPAQDALVSRGWIDAIDTSLKDPLGRKRYAVGRTRLTYLVVCRGVPLRISHEPRYYADTPRLKARAEYQTNQGAVDSELSLLARSTYDINGWVPNPLFLADRPAGATDPVVKVSRLDGPTPEDARRLVDGAIEAERTGLLGRYYIDLKGPHREGEAWFEETASTLAAMGFDGDVNRAGGLLPAGARFDAPALYFGWYADSAGGPLTLDGFRFPPGAIALHLHSYSARTLRSATEGWCGPLVAHGVTATFGNVFEPYLGLTLRPQLLLQALRRGWTLGDAAYFATEALSWQTVVIGDPLYRPFAVPLGRQIANSGLLPQPLAPYAILRQARLLDAEHKPEEARRAIEDGMRRFPCPVLGLALGRRCMAAGDREAAIRALDSIDLNRRPVADELPLLREAALELTKCGEAGRALVIYRRILLEPSPGSDWRSGVLREAIASALAAGDRAGTEAWERELAGIPIPSGNAGKL